jgi:hypothetical protein
MAVTEGRTGTTGRVNHYIVPASAATVHWGYFSRSLKPVLSIESEDFVTIETLTHHAYDDHARHCQLSGPRAPFSGPARLGRGSMIGEQRSSPTRAAAPPTRPAYHGRLS